MSFTAGDSGGDIDAFAVTLYEYGTDNLMGSWTTPQFNPPPFYMMDIIASNIGRAVFDPGNSGVLPGQLLQPGGVVLYDFSYNTDIGAPVPEPATMMLFAVGLLEIVGLGRKNQVC